MIARSPSPPEPDDDGEEWPVHGIVGEDVDVFGISRYIYFYNSDFSSSHFLATRRALGLLFIYLL
jgi:hypothetical protein